ncbi:kelch-like ECH-associated protein 1B isoform X1 [Anopheles funestus]|uniref:kelch-like ECH-associated protein 1B isoform X1 n=1 Tax=Anopheles funestus TaxID=62324 RepID=UPI0020C5FEEE|nr:kelch-like ECH-associated protein 1B isoform X1 [Anopheles funestus]XP_049285644.1 kelch-like ECH-associated protein 1B isoform X1 [Anopheles funestus]XP_049285645.1 kelch-like ECH-associated protein 1B isoform X1 [Anopheles funestus]
MCCERPANNSFGRVSSPMSTDQWLWPPTDWTPYRIPPPSMEATAAGYADCFGNGGPHLVGIGGNSNMVGGGGGPGTSHPAVGDGSGQATIGGGNGSTTTSIQWVGNAAGGGGGAGGATTKEDLGDMAFYMPNYSREVLKMMFMMRSHHMLTDVTLEVEQETFHAHKVVLSAASPYFKAMFTGGLKECEMARVKLQGVCPTAMTRILFFMYTGQIRVTELTVCQLLPAATMFQVPNVIDACCDFLERQLDPTNAIGIANFAEQHGCESLRQKANQFIERNFTQICREEEFLQLSAMQLICLIRKDELNVQGERDVYDAVLKWVKYDEDNRYPKMESILSAVRCQLLTPSFLKEQMKNCAVLRRAPGCREYLAKIFQDLTLHKRPAVRERKPNTTRMIFVAGGYYKHSLDMLEGYNVDDKVWLTLPKLTVPRSGLGAAFLKGTFYAVGGRNNSPGSSYDSDWVDRYNPVTERWRPCSPMSVPRNRVGVAVMDELLYAVGGSSGSDYHNTVEYYDPETDRWTLVQPMQSKRLGVGVAVVNRLLYAIGGFDGKTRLASVERYHPENNAWTLVPPMRYGRSGAGVAALHQYIYVVGGFDGTRQLASVERYDTEQQCWDMVAPVRIARSALSLTVLDGRLYAIGGYDGQDFLTIVEVYDPVRDVWDEGTPLTSGRSGHASAVIYTPSCISSYMEGLNLCTGEEKRRDSDGATDQHHPPSSSAAPPPPPAPSSGSAPGSGSGSSSRPTDNGVAEGTSDSRLATGERDDVLEETDGGEPFAMETDSSQEECDKDVSEAGIINVPLECAPPPEMAHVRESMSSLAIMEHPMRTEILPPSMRLTRRILSCRRTKRSSGKERNSGVPSPSGCAKRSSSATARYTLTLAPVPSSRKSLGGSSCSDATGGGGCKSKRKAPITAGGTTSDDHCPLVRLKKRITCFVSAIVSPTSCSVALPPSTGGSSLHEESIGATTTDDIVPTVPAIVLSTADDLNAVNSDASRDSISFNPAGCNSSPAASSVQHQLRSPNAKL